MPVRNPIQDIRDQVCLEAYQLQIGTRMLALICGVSQRSIQLWIARARGNANPPRLQIMMSGAGKDCMHVPGGILLGMPVICLDCHQTGLPNHPAFRRGRIAGEQEKKKPPAKFKPKIKSQSKAKSASLARKQLSGSVP